MHRTTQKKVVFVLAAFLFVLAAPSVSFAASILNTTGSVTLSATGISFGPSLPTTGVYAGLNGTGATAAPINLGGGAIANFITFTAAPTLSISLNSINGGALGAPDCFVPPAAGQSCTPPGSPFNLVNTPAGAAIEFSVDATGVVSGTQFPITGSYTAQLAGMSYQEALTTLASGGTLNTTYSASFNSTAGVFELTGDIAINSSTISFAQTKVSAGTANSFLIGDSDGIFSPLYLTTGAILNAANNTANLANFMTFAADPAMSITLGGFDPGFFGAGDCFAVPSIGQVCSLPGGILSFLNTAAGSSAIFTMQGTLVGPGGPLPITGLFTTQFVGTSYQAVLAQLVGAGGVVTANYSASFTVDANAVPEPSTSAMLSLGVAIIVLGHARRRRR